MPDLPAQQDDAATDLLALLPASPAPDGPTEDGAGHAPSYDLPARALVPLLRLLHDLASFAPSTKEALLAAPEPSRSLKGKERAAHKSSVMEVDEPNSRWQDPWAFGRIKAILDASLVPVKGAKGDQAKVGRQGRLSVLLRLEVLTVSRNSLQVLRAALKLVAVLKPEHLSTETAIGDLAQACLAHPDEGVRFGAAYASVLDASDSRSIALILTRPFRRAGSQACPRLNRPAEGCLLRLRTLPNSSPLSLASGQISPCRRPCSR
jgi:hypothetical protein